MARERILFIVPPNITYAAYTAPASNVKVVTHKKRSFGALVTDMPLGPLSLSAYVKDHTDAATRMIDFNVVLNQLPEFEYATFKDFFHKALSSPTWQEYSPTVVGISALFGPAYQSMIDIADVAKSLFPTAWILGGGFLPTNMYQQIFADTNRFDGLCFGEGERALVRFVQAEDKATFLSEDPTWITKEKARVKAESDSGRGLITIGAKGLKQQDFRHDLIWNLDEIPFLDYDLCDLEGYRLNPTINAYPALKKFGQAYHVMTSRGCVYSCSFCAQDTVHGKAMRYHSLDRLRQDLTRLKTERGVRTIVIEDDHFMGDIKRAYEILGVLIDLGMTACFPNALALYALKRPMLERLKSVGVDQLVLAVESGSEEVLHKIMRKPLKLDIVQRVTHDCRDVGIYTDCNLVIGQPGETAAHFEESRHFLRGTYANWFRPNVATPITGSELLKRAIDGGHLKGDYTHCDYKKAVIETDDFTAKGLQRVAYLMNLELNFVYNSDFRLGNYEMALLGFENAIQARPDHYFAHYYAAQCHERLGNSDKARHHASIAAHSATLPHWQEWIDTIDAPMSEIAKA